MTVSASAVSPADSRDFALSVNRKLTIATGETESTGTVVVTAVDNAVDDPDRQVTVNATIVGPAGLEAPAARTLTITDDEGAPTVTPTVTLVLAPEEVSENGGESRVTAQLSGATSEDVTLTVSASAVSPADSRDFALSVNRELTIAAGETESTGTVVVTKHLRLVRALLYVAQVVEQNRLKEVELAEGAGQVDVAFRAEQFLDQGVGRGAQHAVASLDQRVPDRTQRVALAHARQAESQHVGRRLEERPGGQRLQLLHHRPRQPAGVERRERLARRQPRGTAQPRDPALASCLGFRLEHLEQHRHRLGVPGLRQPRHELLGRRRQPELRQQRRHLRARRRHPSRPPVSNASYCARSGRGTWTTGTVGTGGRT